MRAYSALCLHEGLKAGSPFWPVSADHTSPASASAAGQLRSGRLAPKRCDSELGNRLALVAEDLTEQQPFSSADPVVLFISDLY